MYVCRFAKNTLPFLIWGKIVNWWQLLKTLLFLGRDLIVIPGVFFVLGKQLSLQNYILFDCHGEFPLCISTSWFKKKSKPKQKYGENETCIHNWFWFMSCSSCSVQTAKVLWTGLRPTSSKSAVSWFQYFPFLVCCKNIKSMQALIYPVSWCHDPS